MQQTAYDFLLQVLTIIDYKDNKDSFINQFIAVCVIEANEHINSNDSSKEAYETALTQSVQRNFEDYIETIIPTLTPSTKTKLLDFLESADSFFGLK